MSLTATVGYRTEIVAYTLCITAPIGSLMAETFDAKQFLDRLSLGEFDGRIPEELRKLTHEQIEQVALLMIARNMQKSEGTTAA